MSALEETELEVEAPAGGSLADRIAQRQRELEQTPEHGILLTVPGFEDLFAVEYRALDFRESWALETRHEKNKDGAEQALFVAADKLLAATQETAGIVEKVGENDYKQTGYKWGVRAARELFHKQLPDGATARQGLLACFPDEEEVIRHCGEYEEQRQIVRKKLDKELEGNSGAS